MNVLIHAAGAVNFGYALYYDLVHVHLPPHLKGKGSFDAMQAFPGKWKYLTVWNMVLQLVYHTIALVNDVVGSSELNPKRRTALQKLRDNIFACWAFPAGLFVSASFWILFWIDRALVFPKEMDEFYPNLLNHGVHSMPFIFLLIESATVSKIFPSRAIGAIANLTFSLTYVSCVIPLWLNHAMHSTPIIFVFIEHAFVPLVYPKAIFGSALVIGGISCYLSWITWVFHVSNVWAYPILAILNNYQRAAFMAGCAVAILSFYFLGDTFNKWRWGSGESKPASGKAAKGKRKVK